MEDTVTVASFAHRYEAEIAQAALESAGIASMVVADDAGGAYAGLSMSGGIRVLVHADNAEKAKQLLSDDGFGEEG